MITWFDGGKGSSAETAVGMYQIVRPHPKSKQFIVRFQRVPMSRRLHSTLAEAKAEAESHFTRF